MNNKTKKPFLDLRLLHRVGIVRPCLPGLPGGLPGRGGLRIQGAAIDIIIITGKSYFLREISHSLCLRRSQDRGTLGVVSVLVGAIQIFEKVFFAKRTSVQVLLLDK